MDVPTISPIVISQATKERNRARSQLFLIIIHVVVLQFVQSCRLSIFFS
jgi:hypothetical protein